MAIVNQHVGGRSSFCDMSTEKLNGWQDVAGVNSYNPQPVNRNQHVGGQPGQDIDKPSIKGTPGNPFAGKGPAHRIMVSKFKKEARKLLATTESPFEARQMLRHAAMRLFTLSDGEANKMLEEIESSLDEDDETSDELEEFEATDESGKSAPTFNENTGSGSDDDDDDDDDSEESEDFEQERRTGEPGPGVPAKRRAKKTSRVSLSRAAGVLMMPLFAR